MRAVETRELALAGLGFLEAIRALLEQGGGSRGSHLVTDPSGALPHEDLGDEWRFIPENMDLRKEILGVRYDASAAAFQAEMGTPRKVDSEECWFENTWAEYRRADVFRKDDSDKALPYKIYQ